MDDEMVETLTERAFRELGRRDAEGSFMKLSYEQARAFRGRDVDVIRPIVDRELKRYKRMLWAMGLSVPLLLAGWIYFNLFRPAESAGAEASLIGVGLAALWAVVSMAYALTMALPRISAMERACALLDAADEHAYEGPWPISPAPSTHPAMRVSP